MKKKIIYVFIAILMLILTGCENKNKVPDDFLGNYVAAKVKEKEFGGYYDIGNVNIKKSGSEYTINLDYKSMRNQMKSNGKIKPDKVMSEERLKLQGKIMKVEYMEQDFEGNKEGYVIVFDPETIKMTGTKDITNKFKVSPQIIYLRKAEINGEVVGLLKRNGVRYKKTK